MTLLSNFPQNSIIYYSASTNSFITSDAVKSFGLSSKTVIYKHSTVDTLCMTTSTKVVNFILYSLDVTNFEKVLQCLMYLSWKKFLILILLVGI